MKNEGLCVKGKTFSKRPNFNMNRKMAKNNSEV